MRRAIQRFSTSLIHRSLSSQPTAFKLTSTDGTHASFLINGKEVKYDWIFLRDSCQCSLCIDTSTRQKLHNTADIPLTISPQHIELQTANGNALEILWNHPSSERHRSLYSRAWLETYASAENIARARYHNHPPIHWTRRDLRPEDLHVECQDYLHSDRGLFTALKHLNDYGLVFIDHVHGELDVERLTERIGDIRHTFYGKSWDVKSVPQATNIAYTSQALELHMDLLYFEAPPGLQFLHSLSNSVQGGASYFVDSFLAADLLRQNDPEAFQSLCTYPVTFHYRNAGRHYHFTRSTIVLDRFSPNSPIDHINYSPPFQAPFESDTSRPEFRTFLRALQRFRQSIEEPSHQLELVLEKGQCVIFHNRRILHARRAFDASSGQRWLKGCYTDLDNFKDRLRVFREKEQA